MDSVWLKLKNSLEKEKDIVIIGSIFILVFLLWLLLFLLPSLDEIRQNEAKIKEIENRQNSFIMSMERMAKSKRMVSLYKSMVIENSDISKIILNLDEAIKQSGVELIRLYPLQEKKEVRYGIAYTVIPIRVIAICTFRELQKMINEVTKMRGFYGISSLSIDNPIFIPPDTVKLRVELGIDFYFIKKKRVNHASKK